MKVSWRNTLNLLALIPCFHSAFAFSITLHRMRMLWCNNVMLSQPNKG